MLERAVGTLAAAPPGARLPRAGCCWSKAAAAAGLLIDPVTAVGRPVLDCLGSDAALEAVVERALGGETASATVQRDQREIELTFEPVADGGRGNRPGWSAPT